LSVAAVVERPNPAGVQVWGKPDDGVGSVFHTLRSASNRPAPRPLVEETEVDFVELNVDAAEAELLCKRRAYWRRMALVVGRSSR